MMFRVTHVHTYDPAVDRRGELLGGRCSVLSMDYCAPWVGCRWFRKNALTHSGKRVRRDRSILFAGGLIPRPSLLVYRGTLAPGDGFNGEVMLVLGALTPMSPLTGAGGESVNEVQCTETEPILNSRGSACLYEFSPGNAEKSAGTASLSSAFLV